MRAVADTELAALDLRDTRWSRELVDSFAINRLRARFVLATYEATLAHIDGDRATAAARMGHAEELLTASSSRSVGCSARRAPCRSVASSSRTGNPR